MAEKEKARKGEASPFEGPSPIDATMGSMSGKTPPMDMPGYQGPMPDSPFDTLERDSAIEQRAYQDKIKQDVGYPEGGGEAAPDDNFPFELPPPSGSEAPAASSLPIEPSGRAPEEALPSPYGGTPAEEFATPYDEPAPYVEPSPAPYVEPSPAPYVEPSPAPYEAPSLIPSERPLTASPPTDFSPSDVQRLARSVGDSIKEELATKIDVLSEDVEELKVLEDRLDEVTSSLQRMENKFEHVQSKDLEEVKLSVAEIKALLGKALPALITEIRASKA